ncbi:MAG: tRNA preQ1(34) S-adenosylmethionine ribosyltransferase-isomerase QueA [Chthonomonadales bacterium]|nr:tRNA preQ1(34) S-adenosylmethionine ribosyltransferase-isomerase QueA [Chthonomonadales bacterium]
MRTDDFDYVLPPELIAQAPLPRGESRLMVLQRRSGAIALRRFADLPEYLFPGDVAVFNDTRVTARRLAARREDGRPVEVLLIAPEGDADWAALVRPGRRARSGDTLVLPIAGGQALGACVVGIRSDGARVLRLADAGARDRLAGAGAAPLPPYIHTRLEDEERYQTVYASAGGSAAAPTAGLHFTPEMLEELRARGVRTAFVTLHVGVDTFRPVRTERVEDHAMHGEWHTVPEATARAVNAAEGRIVAIGTTVARALEAAADEDGTVRPVTGVTRLFITPGYRFRAVDVLLTNLHLPRSSLLMLVSALGGREQVAACYQAAIEARFRFYSFGDAMLVA